MREEEERSEVGRYRIGSVADLTGIPPHTLRAWERRYGAADPLRTDAGFRLYSEDDVGRLTLIKRLSDLGHAIGSIANLSLKELQERLARVEERGWRLGASTQLRPPFTVPAPAPVAERAVPLLILEPVLSAQFRAADPAGGGVEVLLHAASMDELRQGIRAAEVRGPVVVLTSMQRLGPEPSATVRALLTEPGLGALVVLYEFAPRKAVRQLALLGVRMVQGWPGVESLRRTIREVADPTALSRPLHAWIPGEGTMGEEGIDGLPPRVFTDIDLGRLREIDSAIDCECPNHLAQLISGLLSFESYASDCENRDERDAALHLHLHRETARARAIMERALLHLCHEEGIEL